MERLIPIVVFFAAAVMGAWLAPAWADAETVKTAAMFEASGVLDGSSLGRVRTGFGPAPGMDEDDELRRKRPNSADADPLAANRGADPLPRQSDLSGFTGNQSLTNQHPIQNPPPATNNPPVASNPPPTNNPPPAQNTIPATNPTLGDIIAGRVTTILRRNGLLQ